MSSFYSGMTAGIDLLVRVDCTGILNTLLFYMLRDEKLYSNGATDIHRKKEMNRNQTEINTSSSLCL